MILDKINSPKDLKQMSFEELEKLPSPMRELIIKKVNAIGGHMAPNLGIVELTIALHYVFNSPIDKIIFDVSHQCYPHKILTGRKDGFSNPDLYNKYTGYTEPEESEHDIFKIGHTSTSISLATGLAKARDLKGEKHNIIALIGDGSLSGGEALEGLNNSAVLNSNFIIVVNDNDMSIAENQGGLYDNLKLLRETKGQAECNFFKSLGFDYKYIEDGNNIPILISEFSKIKDIDHPIVVHVKTIKGKGLEIAEQNKEFFHWVLPNCLDEKTSKPEKTYSTIAKEYILEQAKTDKTIIAITAATPGVHEFYPDFRKEMGNQYTDVAISEEHAVAYASALAKAGAKPILAVMSSFIQRTYDQLSQDLCLNNSPATILIYWGGLSDADSTHLCSFDIPMMSNIPNLVYLAPTNKQEFLRMLDYSVKQTDRPIAIRVPNTPLEEGEIDNTDYSKINKFKKNVNGEKIAILGLGNFYHKAEELRKHIKNELNIDATLINPLFITGIDENMLEELKENHKLIITLEDGILDGGFGEKIARFYGASEMRVLNYGGKKEFTDRIPLEELYKRYRLTKELITEDIKALSIF